MEDETDAHEVALSRDDHVTADSESRPASPSKFEDVVRRRAELGESWAFQCSTAGTHIPGMSKLARRIRTEVTFLKNLSSGEQVRSSNLPHLMAIAHAAFSVVSDVTAVLQPMPTNSCGDRERLVVDIVADHGNTFIKVIASNRRYCHHKDDGDYDDDHDEANSARFGEKTIAAYASDYVACSRLNPVFYRAPSVEFFFYVRPLPQSPADFNLNDVTIRRYDENLLMTPFSQSLQTVFASPTLPPISSLNVIIPSEIERLNLDVSCMIAYVSALTNGGSNFRFPDSIILSEQAECEGRDPVKQYLDAWFNQGRQLVACSTAVTDYEKIIATVAGCREKERAVRLLERVTVIPDCPTSSLVDRLLQSTDSECRGRINKRSLVIFGTGDALHAITVTANKGFVRSAQSKGVHFAVLLHESRALTESKESTAQN